MANGIMFAMMTSPPYTYNWTPVAGGSYSLTAWAVDTNNLATTSAAIPITVTGPKVLITSPLNGAVIYGNSVVVSGVFSGDGNTSILIDNGSTTRKAVITNNTYSISLPLNVGSNTIKVVARRTDKTYDQATITVTASPNPLVVFMSPSTNTFNAPATIDLTAAALSAAGAISNVKFYQNGTLVGTSTTPPYQTTLTIVGAGTYTVSAIATDNNNRTGSDSLSLSVLDSNIPPTVSLTSPLSGANFTAPATISLAANASDSDGTVTSVQFFQNGTLIGATNTAPYVMTWPNVAAGSYTLIAKATDNRSAVTTSAPITITVTAPNNPPTVTLTSPANGTGFTAPASVVLAATAADSDGTVAKVDFFNGATLIGTATTAPYTVTWANVAAGSYTLTAKATDNRSAVTTSAPITITVTPPNNPPTVTLTSPANGAGFTAPASVVLAATAADSDGTVAKVDFFNGATLIGTTTTAPYTVTWANVAAGTYNVTARVTDNLGATTTTPATSITVNPPPAVTISAPISNSIVTVPGLVTISVNANSANGTVANLQIFDGATQIANYIPPGGYNSITYDFSWSPTAAGTHTLTAVVTDSLNATTTSGPVVVQALMPPTIAFAASSTYFVGPAYIDLYATASAASGATLSKVEIFNGTTLLATLTTPPFNFTWRNVPVGAYSLTAKATDNLGAAIASSPINITIGSAPTMTLDAGLAGSSIADSVITLTGTVQTPPNSAVNVNGKLGTITADGHFIVPDVPLQAGLNTLQLTVTTMDNQNATQPIQVTSTASAPISVSVSPTVGIGSATVSFDIGNPGNVQIGRIDLACADGSSFMSVTTIAEVSGVSCPLPAPGTYNTHINVYDTSSNLIYSAVKPVYINSPLDVARTVRGVYTTLIGRLQDGYTSTAVNTILADNQQQYSAIFTSLGTNLAASAAQLGQVSTINVTGDGAEMVLLRNVNGSNAAFFVYLILGDEGIWRIDSM